MGKKKNNKKKTNRKKILLILLLLIAVFIISIFLMKVRTISVVSSDLQYSKEDVIVASGIPLGQSMFTVDLEAAKNGIEKQLPYADNVTVTKKFPFKIVIKVDNAKQVYSVILSKGLYAVTNEDVKILEVSSVAPEGTIMVQCAMASYNYSIGSVVEFEESEESGNIITALTDISSAVEEAEIDAINLINADNPSRIFLIYDSRIIIEAGNTENLIKKLKLAKKSIDEENKLSSTQYGVMDVSEDAKAIFAPKDYKDMPELVEFNENMEAIEAVILDTEEEVSKDNEDTSEENTTQKQ